MPHVARSAPGKHTNTSAHHGCASVREGACFAVSVCASARVSVRACVFVCAGVSVCARAWVCDSVYVCERTRVSAHMRLCLYIRLCLCLAQPMSTSTADCYSVTQCVVVFLQCVCQHARCLPCELRSANELPMNQLPMDDAKCRQRASHAVTRIESHMLHACHMLQHAAYHKHCLVPPRKTSCSVSAPCDRCLYAVWLWGL